MEGEIKRKKIGKNRDLVKEYDTLCVSIWNKFFEKQGWLNEDGSLPYVQYVCSKDCSIVEVFDMIINIDDAILDLRLNATKGVFEQWYNYNLEHMIDNYTHVNYNSYLIGYRHKERTKFEKFCLFLKTKLVKLKYRLFRIIFRIKNFRNKTLNKAWEV